MLQFLLSLFLIAEAQKSDGPLVKGVKDTLEVCTDIVEAVGDFLSIFETEDRRRADSLGVAVTKKLKVCRQLIELVDAFRRNHFSPMKRGAIALELNEARFLDTQLKSLSKKLGETLYVASKDGDSVATFHSKCDDQGPTVVIVQTTTDAVFGGYTDMSWKHKGWVTSKTSFLFRLRPVTARYPIKSSKTTRAIYAYSSYGPTFGDGHDLYIVNNALSSSNSHTKGNTAYQFPGTSVTYALSDGTYNFKVKDYVVMKAIKM